MIFLANSFSLQMLTSSHAISKCDEISEEKFNQYKDHAESHIGNQDLANMLGVEYHRTGFKMRPGDVLLVAQLSGGRLPEGATTLPDDVKIRYWCVKLLGESESQNNEEILMEE